MTVNGRLTEVYELSGCCPAQTHAQDRDHEESGFSNMWLVDESAMQLLVWRQPQACYICWAQSMDSANPWIALRKVWVHAMRWQSQDCPYVQIAMQECICTIHGLRMCVGAGRVCVSHMAD